MRVRGRVFGWDPVDEPNESLRRSFVLVYRSGVSGEDAGAANKSWYPHRLRFVTTGERKCALGGPAWSYQTFQRGVVPTAG